MKKLSLFWIILICLILEIKAQHAPGLEWKKNYGGKENESAVDVIPTLRGNIALVGNRNETSSFWMVLDKNGKKLREKNFKDSPPNQLKSLLQTNEGFFLLAGSMTNSSRQKMAWLSMMDNKGNFIFSKKIKNNHTATEFTDVDYDGKNYFTTGYAITEQGKELWICCFDSLGNLLWEKLEGRRHFTEGTSIVVLKNERIAIASKVTKNGNKKNVVVLLLKKNGATIFSKKIASRNFEHIQKIIPASDEGLFFVGTIKSNKKNKGNGKRDIWVGKMDSQLNMIWQNTIGGRRNEKGLGMTTTSDGGVVIVGSTFSHGVDFNTSKGFVVKLNQNGKLMWLQEPPFGGSPSDQLNAVTELHDGSLVMIGTTASKNENAKNKDAWVIKIYHEHRFKEGVKTELKITNLSFSENNNTLREGAHQPIKATVKNVGKADAYDVQLLVEENRFVKGVEFYPIVKVGFLAAGDSLQVFIPVHGGEGLELGDANFEVSCTDANRLRSPSLNLKVMTRPKIIPSNFLQIRWIAPDPFEVPNREQRVKLEKFKIQLQAKSDKRLKRKFFTVLVNGKPFRKGQKSGEISLEELEKKSDKIFTYQFEQEVVLQKGTNRIEVVLDNGFKKSSSGIFYLNFSDKPNLHILAIGIEHDDLDYTTNDALDFANSFKDQSGKVFESIFIQTLISGRRNKNGIMETSGNQIKRTFQELSKKYQYDVYERDFLIVFISSHGKNIEGQFKILPSDFELMGEEVLIDFQEDIIEKLKMMKCQKILLIDACQSGSSNFEKPLGVSDNQKLVASAISDFSHKNESINTLASCAADEYSWEDPSWANGAFTEAMLGAFDNEVFEDENGTFKASADNVITFGELYQYIQRRVPQMLKQVQKESNQHPFMENAQYEKLKNVPMYQLISPNYFSKKIILKK